MSQQTRVYPGGWDDEREHAFRNWYGECRRVKPEMPDNPDADDEGLDRRRGYLEIQLKMAPEVPKS